MEDQNPPPPNPVLKHNNSNNAPDAMKASETDSASDSIVREESEATGSMVVKKGRGRPRKYVGNGNLVSPLPTTSLPPPPSGSSAEKRGRGRPRGSGQLQILASTGGVVAETAGGCFTPHVVTVNAGEDVVSRILSFLQRGPEVVCILSAAGAVSSVVIHQSSASGGFLKYEGCFEIISLRGSCTYASGAGGAQCKNCMLSVSLCKPDGGVFGGCIESSMIAATPIQLVMATFKQNIISKQIKRKHSTGSPNAPNASGNQDSVKAQQKVPKLMEGEQSLPSPKSGPMPEAIPNGVPDNVIPATTNGVPNNIIPEDLNMNSESVNDVGLDSKTLEPITVQSKSADVDVNVPLI